MDDNANLIQPQRSRRMALPHEEPSSFDGFYRSHWPAARRLAAFLTQDVSAGEEIAQDAFIAMYRTWGQATCPEAYLRRSVVNQAKNWSRRQGMARSKLRLLVSVDQVDPVVFELADTLAKLTFRQRAVVVLRYYYDLSESEIAEALGCRRGTVKSLASRALSRLAKELDQ